MNLIPRGTYKRIWQQERRAEFKRVNGFSQKANYGTAGLRKAVLERDGYCCVKCGMSDQEHREKWDRPITVDHRDRNRRHNTMENLQTLCFRCHGSKDIIPALKVSKVAPHKERILDLRTQGKSCNHIAKEIGVGCRVITKWLRIWNGGCL